MCCLSSFLSFAPPLLVFQGLVDFANESNDPVLMDGVSATLLNVCKDISPAAAMEFPLAALASLLLWADAHTTEAPSSATPVLASVLTSMCSVMAIMPTTPNIPEAPSAVALAALTTIVSARASTEAGLFAEMVEEVRATFSPEVFAALARVLGECKGRELEREEGRGSEAPHQDDLQLQRCVGSLVKALCLFDPAALASIGGSAARSMAKPVYLPSPKFAGDAGSAALLPAFTDSDAYIQGVLECVASVEGLRVCKLLAECEDSDALASSAFAFSTLSRHTEFRAALARSEVCHCALSLSLSLSIYLPSCVRVRAM
jgi:hypothetical protein